MGTNTLETTYVNGDVIDAAHINEITQALTGSFIGRDTSGVPATGRSLGTLAIPWGNIYGTGLILDGVALDVSAITSSPNRIVSGAERTLSSMPDFMRVDGAALEFDILGATTNLILAINNSATTVNTNITKTGITAAPSSNNTCAVNDLTMTGDKYAGEDGTVITIDAVGSEISSRVGQYVALERTNEIMLAFVNSATQLSDVRRGYFFDSSGNPIVRESLADNDVLTLLSLGWVFVEDNGTTVDVSYRTPIYSYSSPASPVTGDYWYDLANSVWKRYSGASFEIINRTLVGIVASNTTACIGSRCFDYDKKFSSLNSVAVELTSTEIVKSKKNSLVVSVYGSLVAMASSKLSWNMTTNLEAGLTEANSTVYYLYLSDKGQPFISTEKPHYRPELQGDYHPYHSWRMIGMAYNDGSGNIITTWDENTKIFNQATTGIGSGGFVTSSVTFVDVTDQFVNVLVRKPTSVFLELLIDKDLAGNDFYKGFYNLNAATNNQSTYALSINGAAETNGQYFFDATSGGIGALHGLSSYRPLVVFKTGFYKVQLRAKAVGTGFHAVGCCKLSAKEA